MGQAKLKQRSAQNGNGLGAGGRQIGPRADAPPPTNRGGKVEDANSDESSQSVSDRSRVNVSLPPGVYRALASAAANMGTSVSQVALATILAGLPAMAEQVNAMSVLADSSSSA